MEKEHKGKNIILTEEQASRAAETLINSWLSENDSTINSNKDINKK